MRKLTQRSGLLARTALRLLIAKPPRDLPTEPPVLIGGLGGSGSRAIVMLLRRAGWAMGEWIGWDTLDSVPLIFFHGRWLRRLYIYEEAPVRARHRAGQQLRRAAELHRGDQGAPWGWKHTTSALMLPLHTEVYPALRFVHLIRDGRDMALATPHGLMRKERGFLRLDPHDPR